MRAVTWQGKRNVRVDTVTDPTIRDSTDAIVRITSSGICGSDLHLYEVMTPLMEKGDILGHEPIGVVEEVGADVANLAPGDRVVVPFQIACGTCFMCGQGLHTQCETTQVREHGMGAALFGYTKLYGQVPGAQAQYLRVPQAQFGPIKVPDGPPDDRFVYLSDVLPTAWQAVEYADIPPGGSVAVFGLGPIGDMSCRIALHRGASQVIGVDLVPERIERARAHGVKALDLREHDDIAEDDPELDERTRPRFRHRRGRHGGARRAGHQARPAAHDAAPGRAGREDDREGWRRPPRRAARVDRHCSARRHDLTHRRVQRTSRSAADAHPLRQAGAGADGPGKRSALDRRDHAGVERRR